MEEIWKDIPEYEGYYQASNIGRIRSLDRLIENERIGNYIRKGVVLSPKITQRGYLSVALSKKSKTNHFMIQILVAMAFLGHKKSGYDKIVNHKDLNKKNNNIGNLEVISQRENIIHYRNIVNKNYIGVHLIKGRYMAKTSIKGKSINLGWFSDPLEASKKYNESIELIKNNKPIEIYKKPQTSSKYKGVSFCKNSNKWRASFFYKNKHYNVGLFKNEYEAHIAYEDFKNKKKLSII